jgi:hypothetical protein
VARLRYGYRMSTTFRSLALPLLLAALVAGGAAGCGSSSGSDSACSKTAKAICSAACICRGNGACAIGDASGSVSFDNQAGCEALYSLGCSEGAAGIDDAACQAALATPTCVQSTDGRALSLPPACE